MTTKSAPLWLVLAQLIAGEVTTRFNCHLGLTGLRQFHMGLGSLAVF
jgi:hypothetical protein